MLHRGELGMCGDPVIDEHLDGLRASRASEDDVVFGLIAGVPVDLVSGDGSASPDSILADPRMAEVVDTAQGSRLRPSCDVPGRGVAFPPRRLVQAAGQFGDNGVVQSICQADYTAVIDAILQRVARRVSGSCGAN